MATQGFFSPDKKNRMAGEKENKSFFSVEVKPVTLANNINKYNEQTPSLDYAPDRVGEYIKKAEEKSTYQKKIEERNRIAESFGVDPRTGPTYTVRDESKFGGELLRSPFPGVPDRYITTKERISGVTDPRYAKESGFTVTPTKSIIGDKKVTKFQIGVQFDKNKYGLMPAKVLGADVGGMYNFKDPKYGESTKAFVAGMAQMESDKLESERIQRLREKNTPEYSKMGFANFNEDGSLKTPSEKSEQYNQFLNAKTQMENEFAKRQGYESFSDYQKAREDFNARINAKFDDNPYFRQNTTGEVPTNPKFSTMPSMTISKEGRKEAEKNRLEKAKEEGRLPEQRNVFQRIGDTVGNVFNRITGTEAAGAGTLQSQGINTSATTNISQMGNVSPTVQRAREAVEKSVIRQTGMPSNPKGFSGYSRSSSTSTGGGISKSTSRGQGGRPGSRSRGGTGTGRAGQGSKSSARGARGSAGSRSRGGTGSGRTSTSRSASKASKGRTGRGRSQCDIRTKIDISPLINSNLVKDNLAEVAYFVQEIRD